MSILHLKAKDRRKSRRCYSCAILKTLTLGYSIWSWWQFGNASIGLGIGLLCFTIIGLIDCLNKLVAIIGRRYTDKACN